MAYFAKLDQNSVVTEVIAVNNETIDYLPFPESEPVGIEFCQSLFGLDTIWKQTSYNSNFRGVYAGIGYSYDPSQDIFIPPQPYPNWTYGGPQTGWVPPVPYPTDGNLYVWDPATTTWVLAEAAPAPVPSG